MTRRAELPIGMTPRLLCREAAAAYCGISPNHFDEHIAAAVRPLEFGGRKVWDIRALDRWLDVRSGLAEALPEPGNWLRKLGAS